LQPGEEVKADGPEGDFVIEDETRNYIFVAGGIGVTPFRSILVEAHALSKQLPVNLLYANRDEDVPFKDQLEGLAADNPNLKIEYFISPNTLSAALIKQRADDAENPLIFLSGPEPMVKSLAAELESLGVSKDSIKLDDFPGYEGI
jgi:ferredoxin-NADP reductase